MDLRCMDRDREMAPSPGSQLPCVILNALAAMKSDVLL